jgi:transcriptional regulator with XRE-family HTH domain
MTNITKQMGRPTTRIDPITLARLRKEEGLSQFALAKAVYVRASKPWTSKHSLNTTAQRWESKGNISGALLVHLAAVLKTSVEILKGEKPGPAPSRQEEIEALLQTRVQDKKNTVLLKRLAEVLRYEQETPLKDLAEDIAREIEVAQLSQSREELEQLSAITGLDAAELLRPLSQKGLWLLVGSGAIGLERQELFYGVTSLKRAISEEFDEQSEQFSIHDAEIKFMEEGLWIKASWTQLHHREFRRSLKFVRCQATSLGLTWVMPSALDRLLLEDLRITAYKNFSRVGWFDAAIVPSNISQLRLVVKKYLPYSEKARLTGALEEVELFEHSGTLLNMSAARANINERDGQASYYAMEALGSGLWQRLEPLLEEFPLQYWSFGGGGNAIEVILHNIPLRLWYSASQPPQEGMRYSIRLVELLADGSYQRSPCKPAAFGLIFSALEIALRTAREAAANPDIAS